MLKLWHCVDARSFRALWALEELELDYDLHMLPFPPRVQQKDYLGENPLGTIPLLVDGATRMTESCAIAHYLACRYGQGQFTAGPQDAEFGAYLNWLHHGEATLTFPQTLVLRYSMLESPERRQPQVAEDYRIWFLARLRLVGQALADGRPFLLEQGFTMADIGVGYAILLAEALGLRDELPQICVSWHDALRDRPAFVRAQTRQLDAARAAGLAEKPF